MVSCKKIEAMGGQHFLEMSEMSAPSNSVAPFKRDNKEAVALKRENKKAVALKTDKKEEMLVEQVIKRFPQEKRRNSFEEIEEQKGKWRRREKAEDDFDNILELEEVREMGEKQAMDEVTILMMEIVLW